MGGVGLVGVLLGLTGLRWAFLDPTRLRVVLFLIAYLMHLASCLLYFTLVGGGGGDAQMYFSDPLRYYHDPLQPGTVFIVYITQFIKLTFGGGMIDFFFLYQGVGFFGIALLMRVFEETFATLQIEQPFYSYLILFLPGIHYWSSGIGKDSLFFFATCLALWAMINMRARSIALAFAILLMLAIRPHVAALALAALAITVILERRTKLSVKVVLSVLISVALAFSISQVWSTFQIDLTNANAVSDHLAGREALVQTEAAGNTSVDAAYPVRVLSLLFRPLFLDASGVLGLIVSMENAILLIMILALLWQWSAMVRLFKTVPFIRYALISSIAILLTLALGYYNIGLGIRQKATMILPGILVAFVAVRAVVAAQKRQVQPVAAYFTKGGAVAQ